MTEQKWAVVYTTYGLFDAEVIVGRLQAEGIPARAWAESAGRALGLTVGKLGTSYIEVPEIYMEDAEAIIEMDFSAADESETDSETDADDNIEDNDLINRFMDNE
ncbi:MAG: hypothetical protein QNJ45_21605 [Ardenticatenaceae bacterium]|nr:hypothetical protein [Ardenticatenaceae bacterium]